MSLRRAYPEYLSTFKSNEEVSRDCTPHCTHTVPVRNQTYATVVALLRTVMLCAAYAVDAAASRPAASRMSIVEVVRRGGMEG